MNLFLILFTICFSIFFFKIHTKFAEYFNLFDVPNNRKIHKIKVPLTGGIGIFLLFFSLFLLDKLIDIKFSNSFFSDNFLQSKLIFLFIFVFLTGFIDDKFSLTASKKTIFLILIFGIYISQIQIFQIKIINIENLVINLDHLKISLIFTILCFFIYNISFNMFDGINLQSCIYSIFFSLNLYLLKTDPFLISLISFLFVFGIFNKSSKVFLGDSGCNLLSTIFSIYCIQLYNVGLINIEQIFILMLLPGLDMSRLFFTRLINKKSPFMADKFHFHHLILTTYSYFHVILFLILFLFLKSILFFYFPNFYSIFILTFIYFIIFVHIKNKIKNKS